LLHDGFECANARHDQAICFENFFAICRQFNLGAGSN
jgi:hypothetical protein